MPSNTTIPTLATGNVLSAAEWNDLTPLNTTVGLFGKGTALAGSLSAVTAPNWLIQGGQASFTFSSGLSGTFNFPTAFPNGLLTVSATPIVSGTPADLTLNLTGFTISAFSLGATNSGAAYTGTFAVSWFAIGC